MLKDEFDKEELLKTRLNEYEVEVPKQLAHFKTNRWLRFVEYLASPTKDPLEDVNSSSSGFTTMQIMPIASAVFITILQLLIQ